MRDITLAISIAVVFGCYVTHAFIAPAPAVVRTPGAATSSIRSSIVSASTRALRRRGSALAPLQQQEQPDVETAAPEGSMVLIEVSKKNARVFKSVAKGSVAEIVEPVDEWRVHEQSNKEKRSQGQGKHHAEKADPVNSSYLVKFYMEKLSGVINAADSVLLVGHGNAKSNLAESLATALCERQPDLTGKIADVLRLDGKHITENQLLKLGRRHLLHTDDPRRPT